MKLQESGENYLETILILRQRNGYVRSTDVAKELDFSKPSISRAMKILKQAGYITMEPDGNLVLTEEGNARANAVYERHRLITRFLVELGVSKETAAQDACRIEHIISEESFEQIRRYVREHDPEA